MPAPGDWATQLDTCPPESMDAPTDGDWATQLSQPVDEA